MVHRRNVLRNVVLVIALSITIVSLVLMIFPVNAQTPESTSSVVVWSPDGKLIAVSGWFGIHLYTPQLILVSPQIKSVGVVNSIAWSPDSTKLASADADYNIRLWDVSTGKATAVFTGHFNSVESISWSPDGSKLASSSKDSTVRIWDAHRGSVSKTIQLGYVSAVSWSPDGSKLAIAVPQSYGFTDVKILDISTGTTLYILKSQSVGHQRTMFWSSDSKHLLFLGPFVIDVKSAQRVSFPTCDGNESVAWSRDGHWIAGAGLVSGGGIGCMIDTITTNEIWLKNFPDGDASSLSFSSDGLYLVAVTDDGVNLSIWDTLTGQILHRLATLPSPTPPVNPQPLQFTSVCSSANEHYRVWHLLNPNPYQVFINWIVVNSSQSQESDEVIPAAVGQTPGERFFKTVIEAASDTVQIRDYPPTVNDSVVVGHAVSNSVECPTSTNIPMLTVTATATQSPTAP